MMRLVCLVGLIELVTAGAVFAQEDAARVARGQKVYVTEKCSICHAVAGKGNPKGALDSVGSKLSAVDIRRWIVNAPEMTAKTQASRKPAMKAYTAMPEDDLEALVAYLQSLKS